MPASAVSPDGFAGGGILGVAEASAEAAPAPERFRARTWNVYAVSFTSDFTAWAAVAAPLPGMSVQLP